MYKYVDENGKTHYASYIPPQYAKNAHAEYRQGLKVKTTEKAKDPKVLKHEQELKRAREQLRRENALLAKKQRAKDKKLLNTYQNEDDIILYRDGKLRSVDAQIDITRANVERLKKQIEDNQRNMANLERQGKKIPEKLIKRNHGYEKQIEKYYALIVTNKKLKQDIFDESAKDIQHFRKLKKVSKNRPAAIKSKVNRKSLELYDVVICRTKKTCKKYWNRAKAYLKKYATTPISLVGDNIIMTERPVEADDISLALSKNEFSKKETRFFLDVQCSLTVEGTSLCKSKKVNAIRHNFRRIVEK